MEANKFNFRVWNGEIMIYNNLVRILDSCTFTPFTNSESSVMQSTGLVDKNGREIYDSDIVKVKICEAKCPEDLKYVVCKIKWGSMAFTLQGIADGGVSVFCPNCEIIRDYEVLGNICENGDLLKEGYIK